MYVQYAKGRIWNSTELAEKAISAPNPQRLPQKDVEGNITLLISESKTTLWKKTEPLDPNSEACQTKGQAIGMWETHGLMTHINKASFTTIFNRKICSTSALTEDRFDMSLAPRFFNGEVAQMVERSLCMREVRGSMPRMSNFSEEPGNRKRKYGKLFC